MRNIVKAGILTAVAIIVIVGGIALANKAATRNDSTLSDASQITISPQDVDYGNVPIDGGIIEREYEIKNTSAGSVKIKKFATSCMCTTAKIVYGDKETKSYGMEMAGDMNPIVGIDIPSGESVKAVVAFDPAAHGPQGTGPFERVVSFYFADPVGIKNVNFKGVVVN